MKILIDNGHGENTPGKRSPDGSLREYAYAREIANRIAHELSARGYDAERIVRETVDVPLSERARRVNEVCGRYGTANVVLVSFICRIKSNIHHTCQIIFFLYTWLIWGNLLFIYSQ